MEAKIRAKIINTIFDDLQEIIRNKRQALLEQLGTIDITKQAGDPSSDPIIIDTSKYQTILDSLDEYVTIKFKQSTSNSLPKIPQRVLSSPDVTWLLSGLFRTMKGNHHLNISSDIQQLIQQYLDIDHYMHYNIKSWHCLMIQEQLAPVLLKRPSLSTLADLGVLPVNNVAPAIQSSTLRLKQALAKPQRKTYRKLIDQGFLSHRGNVAWLMSVYFKRIQKNHHLYISTDVQQLIHTYLNIGQFTQQHIASQQQ